MVGDFTGDGVADLLAYGTVAGGTEVLSYNPQSQRFDRSDGPGFWWTMGNPRFIPLDVNGDGLHDIIAAWPKDHRPTPAKLFKRPALRLFLATGTSLELANNAIYTSATSLPSGVAGTPLAQSLYPRDRLNAEQFHAFDRFDHTPPLPILPTDLNGDGRGDLLVPNLRGHATAFATYMNFVAFQSFGQQLAGYKVNAVRSGNWDDDFTHSRPQHVMMDMDGDGDVDLVEVDHRSGADPFAAAFPTANLTTYVNKVGGRPVLTRVRSPLAQVTVDYAPMTDAFVYTKTHDCAYPEQCVADTRLVVKRTCETVGWNALCTDYRYKGAKVDVCGGGWLGFSDRMETTKNETRLYRYDQRRDDRSGGYPYAGVPVETLVYRSGGDWGQHQRGLRFVATHTKRDREVVHSIYGQHRVTLRQVTTTRYASKAVPAFGPWGWPTLDRQTPISVDTQTFSWDTRGQVTRKGFETRDGKGVITAHGHTTYAYHDRWRDHIFDLPARIAHTEKGDGGGCHIEQTQTLAYVPGTSRLAQVVVAPNDPAAKLTLSYTYDPYGNLESLTRSADGQLPRKDTWHYDRREHLYPVHHINALGHETRDTYYPPLDVRTGQVDENGLTDRFQYDRFGRMRGVWPAGAPGFTLSYRITPYVIPSTMQTRVTREGGGWSEAVQDGAGRALKSRSLRFGGQVARTDAEYNAWGKPTRVTEARDQRAPATPPPPATTYDYDPLGLMRRMVAPDGAEVNRWYGSNAAYTQDPLGHVTKTTLTPSLQPRRIDAPEGASVGYSYCADGRIRTVTDPSGAVTTNHYDAYGRAVGVDAPDTGRVTRELNAFGEVVAEVDALGQRTTYEYDRLGRVTKTVAPDMTTTFTYDKGPHAVGKLVSARSEPAVLPTATSSQRDAAQLDFAYDRFGRLASVKQTLGDAVLQDERHYDESGRLHYYRYPRAGIRPVEGEMATDRRFRARRDDEEYFTYSEEEQRGPGASGQVRSPPAGMDHALVGSGLRSRSCTTTTAKPVGSSG